MKKIQIKSKLSVSKTTIANLNKDDKRQIKGGHCSHLSGCHSYSVCMSGCPKCEAEIGLPQD